MFVSFEDTILYTYDDEGMMTDSYDVGAKIQSACMNGNVGILVTEGGYKYKLKGDGFSVGIYNVY